MRGTTNTLNMCGNRFNGNVHIIGSRTTPHGITLHPNYCPPRPSIKARHVAWPWEFHVNLLRGLRIVSSVIMKV